MASERTEISNDHYLLVSDSNEVSRQYDSKKLKQSDFVEMAQDNLFKNHLNMMDEYLTNNMYKNLKSLINNRLLSQQNIYNQVKNLEWSGKFAVVDGQVILIEAEQVPNDITPLEYLKSKWNITSDYNVLQLGKCMLRGMTEIKNDAVVRGGQEKIMLGREQIPIHMHQSSVTSNANIRRMVGSTNASDRLGKNDGTVYDVFYNDSFSTGLDQNEIDGVVDTFKIHEKGEERGVYHENLPLLHEFYAFVITKVGK